MIYNQSKSTMRKKIIFALSAISLLLLTTSIIASCAVSDVERPKYQITSQNDNNIEIRKYEPKLIAEVEVAGNRDQAIDDGFQILADYIFGNNTVQQSIDMTAPVQQERSTKIAMTAPVEQQKSNDSWKVSFIMPSKYTLQTLPMPNDKRIKIIEVPSKKYITIEFSGFISDDNINEHQQKLLDYISQNKLKPLSQPKYAFYNPPWTLPFMRRNEVMVEIE